ncbi:MAG: FixH family protein [Deltaproteobacteria bacterium]|nr:FixH family protein [Deltaproteobacteria bacterium]
MTRLRALASPLVLAASALVVACGGDDAPPPSTFPSAPLVTVESRDGKLSLSMWTAPEQPPSRGIVTAKMHVTHRDKGTPADGLRFAIVPEMPSMGHGTPTVPRTTEKGQGDYLVEDLDLFMAGRWDLLITITGEVTDAAVVPIDVR